MLEANSQQHLAESYQIMLELEALQKLATKRLVTNYGEGGGATRRERGAHEVLPLWKERWKKL